MRSLLFCKREDSTKVLNQVLGKIGIRARRKTEVFSTVEALMSERFDLLIIDVGEKETARLLLKSARHSDINKDAVVIGVADSQRGADAFRLGADFFLTKPIRATEAESVLLRVRAILRK